MCVCILQANLNDSHNQMVVHWAGEKSNVIVALARDSAGATGPKTSSVSTDQRLFQNKHTQHSECVCGLSELHVNPSIFY